MNKLTTFLFTLVLGLGFTINAEAQDCRNLLGEWEGTIKITKITHSVKCWTPKPHIGEEGSGTFEFTWASHGTATGYDDEGDKITAMWNEVLQQFEIAYNWYISDMIYYVTVDKNQMNGTFWIPEFEGTLIGKRISLNESIYKPTKPENVKFEAPKIRIAYEFKCDSETEYSGLMSVVWDPVEWEETYILYYAPYPNVEWINSAKMGLRCHLSGWLPEGSAYYVAVMACDENYENCSDCSNVMVINLLSYNAPPTFEMREK